VVIGLERGADLHTSQLMPLPPTVSCFSKIQIGFTFLVPDALPAPNQQRQSTEGQSELKLLAKSSNMLSCCVAVKF